MVAHMSVWLDIYRTTTLYIVTTTIYELVFAPCAFSDLYRTFFCQIEFMVAHMSGLPTYITEKGYSYVRHDTIYEPAFFMKKRKSLGERLKEAPIQLPVFIRLILFQISPPALHSRNTGN